MYQGALWTACIVLAFAALGFAVLSEKRLVEHPTGIEWAWPLLGAMGVQALVIATAYLAGKI